MPRRPLVLTLPEARIGSNHTQLLLVLLSPALQLVFFTKQMLIHITERHRATINHLSPLYACVSLHSTLFLIPHFHVRENIQSSTSVLSHHFRNFPPDLQSLSKPNRWSSAPHPGWHQHHVGQHVGQHLHVLPLNHTMLLTIPTLLFHTNTSTLLLPSSFPSVTDNSKLLFLISTLNKVYKCLVLAGRSIEAPLRCSFMSSTQTRILSSGYECKILPSES